MKHVFLVHDLMQSIIRCLLAFSPFYFSSSQSGPWPEAFIRATTQSSAITNILSRSGGEKGQTAADRLNDHSIPPEVKVMAMAALRTKHTTQPLWCRPCFFLLLIWFFLLVLIKDLWAERWRGSWTAFPCRFDHSFLSKLCFIEPTVNIGSVTTITVTANERGKRVWFFLVGL